MTFENDFARNVMIFAVDNGLSNHSDNRKNNFSILDEGPAYGINTSKICLGLDDNVHNSYLIINGKEISKFKVGDKHFNFQTQFCQGSISNGFSATDSKEVSLHGNKYDFLVD